MKSREVIPEQRKLGSARWSETQIWSHFPYPLLSSPHISRFLTNRPLIDHPLSLSGMTFGKQIFHAGENSIVALIASSDSPACWALIRINWLEPSGLFPVRYSTQVTKKVDFVEPRCPSTRTPVWLV